MIRPIATEVILFLAPFVLYAAFIWATKARVLDVEQPLDRHLATHVAIEGLVHHRVPATPERVWHALTDADLTTRYWGHANVSDWQPGSTWRHVRTDGSGIAAMGGTALLN